MQNFEYTATIDTDALEKSLLSVIDNINLSSIMFLDIETTGLSPKNAVCYLIGMAFIRDNRLICRQVFADTPDDERDMLELLLSTIHNGSIIATYNGNTFDLPFIRERCRRYNISTDIMSHCRYIDIYSHIRKLNRLLKLDNLKQKSIEHFCDIDRDDSYSGKELIRIYKDYIIKYKLHDKPEADVMLNALLTHNKDDVMTLPSICQILSYNNIFNMRDSSSLTVYDVSTGSSSLTYTLKSDTIYPGNLSMEHDGINIKIANNTITVTIPVISDTLRHFYPDYRNYYYLPDEDRAIHKSIAAYVDSTSKEKAHKENCYTKKDGYFIPFYDETKYPCFKYNYNNKSIFIQYNEEQCKDTDFIKAYISDILHYVSVS